MSPPSIESPLPVSYTEPSIRFLGSPKECVSECSLWTGSKSMAWEFAVKAHI
ncbi:hypothetical protein LEMLEM_LOCUS8371 [Lemmus lemmus]